MPDVDGIAATREICARLSPERRPAIISVSAGTSERYKRAAAEAGMVGRISKPVTTERLVQILRRVRPLGAHAQSGAPERSAIDVTALADRVGGLSDDQLGRVVEDFLAQGKTALEEMAAAAQGRDTSAFARAAHSLLGSALLLEAGPLSEHLRRSEDAADAGEEDLAALADRARQLFASAGSELAAYLSSR
jgi:CheY-like chemotaxis protein